MKEIANIKVNIHYSLSCPYYEFKIIGIWIFKKKIKVFCQENIKIIKEDTRPSMGECPTHGKIKYNYEYVSRTKSKN